MDTYKIVCFVFQGDNYTVRGKTGLTLEEAQRICNDPETSSRTCKGAKAKARTARLKTEWFYGYTKE